MTFTYQPEVFSDGSRNEYWFAGIYKIVAYPAFPQSRIPHHFQAYFKPREWKHWGNAVDQRSYANGGYATLTEAQSACERHAASFSDKPHANE